MTYSELLTKVAAWMNRDDLAAMIPGFVELTEERLNRYLRVRQMEVTLTATPIVNNQIALASDIVDAKLLWVLTGCPLKAQSLESVTANGTTGTPSLYALSGGNLVFDGTGDVQGVLYQRIPALATVSTNWLSVAAPSLYLFGALAEAKLYVGDEAGAQYWDARFQGALDELAGNDNRLSGPLTARAR